MAPDTSGHACICTWNDGTGSRRADQPEEPEACDGQDAVLSVTGTTKQATFTSSNTKVASVGKKSGRVTVKKAGTATITARVKGSHRCKVTVTEGDYKKLYREFLAANRRSIGKFYVLNVDKQGCRS